MTLFGITSFMGCDPSQAPQKVYYRKLGFNFDCTMSSRYTSLPRGAVLGCLQRESWVGMNPTLDLLTAFEEEV